MPPSYAAMIRAMRIMHTILSRGFAGSERAAAELCNAFATAHEVMLVIRRGHANRHGVSIRQWIDPRVQVVEVSDWLPRSGIAKAIESFKPDVIHAHLRRSTRMLARICARAPTVVTLHLTVNGPHFAEMDGIICTARWQHADIPDDYRGRVFDIRLPYTPHRRLTAQEIATLRAELGVASNEYLVGGVGRLARTKGFDILIEAFKRAALADAKLVILGEGRERRRLEKLLAPGISLPGFRTNAKDYYQAFDLFVCPSRSEPFGYVLLEALDAGVPVIGSAAHGPSEILSLYPGDLFPIDDTAALASLLRKHYAEGRLKQPHDLGPFKLERIVRETEAAYRELIELKNHVCARAGAR